MSISHMKRTISIILTMLILASSVACGSSGQGSETTAGNNPGDETTAEITTALDDGLPDKKFGGKTITFGVSTESESDIIADEENGDVVNDAMVKRNRTIEERFDVKIESVIVTDGLYDWYDKLSTYVLAGDALCDVAGHYAYQTYKAAQLGIYQDWNTIPYVDQSKPW